MEVMKINSEIGYNRDRVVNGNSPHELLKMIQQEMSDKITKDEIQEEQ